MATNSQKRGKQQTQRIKSKNAKPFKNASLNYKPVDIPFKKDGSQKFLPWMMGLMVFLSLCALSGALSLNDMADRWGQGMQNALSIELPAPIGEDRFSTNINDEADNLSNDQLLARAIAIAQSFDGIIQVVPLSDADMMELIEPWLGGDDIALNFLPLPRILNLVIDPDNPPDSERLAQELNLNIPGAKLIEFDEWRLRLVSYINALRLLAGLIIIVMCISVGGLVVFVSLSGLTAYKDAVELLHIMGAHDGYIARQFQKKMMGASLKGGVTGFLLATILILTFGHFVLTPDLRIHNYMILSPDDWLYLLSAPLFVTLIATLTARVTILLALAKMN